MWYVSRSLEVLIGIGAVIGGGALLADPSGRLLSMPTALLEGSPFQTYLVPGLLLAAVVGGSMLLATLAQLRRWPRARAISFAAGTILIGWIATQIAMIGYQHPIQAVYLALGVLVAAMALVSRPVR